MTLPIPPSDSLYKFTAIGGLVLVVLSLYLPWKMKSDLEMGMLDFQLGWQKMQIEGKSLDRAMDEVKRQTQYLEDEIDKVEQDQQEHNNEFQKRLNEIDKVKQDLEKRGNELGKRPTMKVWKPSVDALDVYLKQEIMWHERNTAMFDRMQSKFAQVKSQLNQMREGKYKELEFLTAQTEHTLGKQKLLKEESERLDRISNVTFCYGFFLMVIGFSCWYFKFQIYQDRIIKAQANQWATPRPEREKEEVPG